MLREEACFVPAPCRRRVGWRQNRDEDRGVLKLGYYFRGEDVIAVQIVLVFPNRKTLGAANLLSEIVLQMSNECRHPPTRLVRSCRVECPVVDVGV